MLVEQQLSVSSVRKSTFTYSDRRDPEINGSLYLKFTKISLQLTDTFIVEESQYVKFVLTTCKPYSDNYVLPRIIYQVTNLFNAATTSEQGSRCRRRWSVWNWILFRSLGLTIRGVTVVAVLIIIVLCPHPPEDWDYKTTGE